MEDFYTFKVEDIRGHEKQLGEYKDKVVLVVNTASKCAFTPQYEGLEKMYVDNKDKGFVVLGFPCNQFGGQEPGDNTQIQEGCLLNYGVTFPMFSKIDVNGPKAHPLFNFLKRKKGSLLGRSIRWNFTKFLINKNGEVIKRFSPWTKPEKIEKYITKLL